jgi:hypothetical protein
VKNLLMRLSTLDMLRRLLFEFLVWSFSVPNTVEAACVLLKYSMEAC